MFFLSEFEGTFLTFQFNETSKEVKEGFPCKSDGAVTFAGNMFWGDCSIAIK